MALGDVVVVDEFGPRLAVDVMAEAEFEDDRQCDPKTSDLARLAIRRNRPVSLQGVEVAGHERHQRHRGNPVRVPFADVVLVGQFSQYSIGDSEQRASKPGDRPAAEDAVSS